MNNQSISQPQMVAIYDYNQLVNDLDARFEARVQAEVEKRTATKRYYSMGEVSTIFGNSSKTIERWHKAGKLCYSTVTEGGGKLFCIDEVHALQNLLKRDRDKMYHRGVL
jgi:hypothetical protein